MSTRSESARLSAGRGRSRRRKFLKLVFDRRRHNPRSCARQRRETGQVRDGCCRVTPVARSPQIIVRQALRRRDAGGVATIVVGSGRGSRRVARSSSGIALQRDEGISSRRQPFVSPEESQPHHRRARHSPVVFRVMRLCEGPRLVVYELTRRGVSLKRNWRSSCSRRRVLVLRVFVRLRLLGDTLRGAEPSLGRSARVGFEDRLDVRG